MEIKLGKYSFRGPFASIADLKETSGIYVILCKKSGRFYVVDVGESENVKTGVENHKRRGHWKDCCFDGILYVSAYYTPDMRQEERAVVEQEIKEEFNPPCCRINL